MTKRSVPAVTKTLDYEGVTVEYNPLIPKSWKFSRIMVSRDPSAAADQMAMFDELFLGKSDEVADELEAAGLAPDGTMAAMQGVIERVVKASSGN